jgi:hypothetical protein
VIRYFPSIPIQEMIGFSRLGAGYPVKTIAQSIKILVLLWPDVCTRPVGISNGQLSWPKIPGLLIRDPVTATDQKLSHLF